MVGYLVNYGGTNGKSLYSMVRELFGQVEHRHDRGEASASTATAKTSSNDEFVKLSGIDHKYFAMLYEMNPLFAEAVDMSIERTEERLAKRELFREKSSSYNRKCKNTILARKRKRWNIANNLHRNSFQREGRR